MKVPLGWLNTYCDISEISSNQIQKFSDDYTIYTAEVEEIIPHMGIDKVVIGKVLSHEKHPDADKLTIVQVDLGKHGKYQIVCGAPNITSATYVPVAREGCQMAPDFIIGKRDLKGVASCGMICSADELDLQPDRSAGILDLEKTFPDTDFSMLIGKDFFDLKLDFIAAGKHTVPYPLRDYVMDLDNKFITNRPDLFGVYGNARECSAIYRKELETYTQPKASPENSIVCSIETDAVYTYCLQKYKNINTKESPLVIKTLLHRSGLGVKNNAVDLTNLICTEIAQPMHCFDADKIQGNITVRHAKKGETCLALDDVEHELTPDDIVIADDSGCIAIAGVIGGKNTATTETTENILIEAATFDPVKVRKTASRLGIRTESSMRFEKSLDPTTPQVAIARFDELQAWSGLKGKKDGTCIYTTEHTPVSVTLDWENVKKRISKDFDDESILASLERLGFTYDGFVGNSIQIQVPSWRATKDISIQEDIIEEIARMLNYNTYDPVKLCEKITTVHIDPSIQTEQKLRQFFIRQGFFDAYTYTFTHPEKNNYFQKETTNIELSHPYSEDHSVMRAHLFDSLLTITAKQVREHDTLMFFESGTIFGEKLAGRQARISAGVCVGETSQKLNTILTNALTTLGNIGEIHREQECPENKEHIYHPNKSAVFYHGGKAIAIYGRIHPSLAKLYEVPDSTLLFEFFDTSFVMTPNTNYTEVPKFPAIVRELNFVMDENIPVSSVSQELQSASELVQEIRIGDIYRDKEKVGTNKKAVVFLVTLLDHTSTLTDEKAGEVQSAMIDKLAQRDILLRG